jgi:hypothetical protein
MSVEDRVVPQVSVLVHRDVLAKFDLEFRNVLTQFLGSFVFLKFCEANLKAVEEDIRNLAPTARMTPDEYFQLSKDMRLVWRFWTDLQRFSEEFKQK